MVKIIALLLLALILSATPAFAQTGSQSIMECSACQMVLKMVELSAPDDPSSTTVDMTKQCAMLKKEDRRACAQFYSAYGPKFIQALRDRRANGETVQQICSEMTYCQ